MKRKLILSGLATLLMNLWVFAQWEGGPGGDPPTPEGDGSQSSPIDMYQVYLLIVGIALVVYFAMRIYQKQKLKQA